jgi:hypothetical protein
VFAGKVIFQARAAFSFEIMVTLKVWRDRAASITGFIQFEYSLAGKWMELLKEVASGVTRVGGCANRRSDNGR